MAWHRAHDESAQGQRDSSYVQPSRGRHGTQIGTTKNYPAELTAVDHGGALHAGALCARRCMKRVERQLDRIA